MWCVCVCKHIHCVCTQYVCESTSVCVSMCVCVCTHAYIHMPWVCVWVWVFAYVIECSHACVHELTHEPTWWHAHVEQSLNSAAIQDPQHISTLHTINRKQSCSFLSNTCNWSKTAQNSQTCSHTNAPAKQSNRSTILYIKAKSILHVPSTRYRSVRWLDFTWQPIGQHLSKWLTSLVPTLRT